MELSDLDAKTVWAAFGILLLLLLIMWSGAATLSGITVRASWKLAISQTLITLDVVYTILHFA